MIKLYLDEDVPEAVAIALKLRGYDVTTVREMGRKSMTDVDQLKYAYSQQRVILTHNIADFSKIHFEFAKDGWEHSGIILSRQLPIGLTVKALLKLLSSIRAEGGRQQLIWLSDWIT